MAINIHIVKEDLITIVQHLDGIEVTDDFYYLQKAAREMQCYFIATIDEASDTLFNYPQREILEMEIKKMRACKNINQTILDQFQGAIDACEDRYHVYIKFLGD